MLNKVFMNGRITKEWERSTYGGNKVMARGNIAVQRDFKDKNGEYIADFFNLTLFGKSAEFAMKYINKGDLVSIEASLQNNNYQKDGKTVYNDNLMNVKISKLVGGSSQETTSVNEVAEEEPYYETSKDLPDEEDMPF